MKFRLITLAAIAACGSAHALSPAVIDADRAAGTLKEVVIHGASAQSPLVGAYMAEICNSNLDTFFNSGGSGTGKDYRAYSCTLKNAIAGGWAAGTPVLVIKRDLGGSIYGVNPIFNQTQENTMVVDATAGNCVSTGLPATASQASYNCANVALRQAIAGLSDVEPAIFNKTMTVGTTAGVAFNLPAGNDDNGTPWAVLSASQIAGFDSATANQTIFGVAVSLPLRNAMQAAQGLSVGSDAAADQPSMSRAFYSALAAGFVQAGVTKHAGWDAITGVPADNALQVNLCRRANGSGTQASSNLFFLEAGTIATTVAGGFAPVNSNGVAVARTGNPLAVIENSSTGTAVSCLTTASSLNAYAAGIISFENDPGTATWRFVKLDGQAPTQALARVGQYPYVYGATMQWKKAAPGNPDTQTKSFLVDMRKNLGSPAKIAALTNPIAQKGVLAPPSSYTGTCASQTAGSANALYGSCVERLDFASLYNDGVLFYGLAASAAYKTNSSQPLHFVK